MKKHTSLSGAFRSEYIYGVWVFAGLMAFVTSAQAQSVTNVSEQSEVEVATPYASSVPSTSSNLLSSATLNAYLDGSTTPSASPYVAPSDAQTSTSWTTLVDGVGENFGSGFENGVSNSSVVEIQGSGPGDSLVYTLSPATLGYNITTIDVFTGWQDQGRIDPDFSISYSTVAAPTTFIPLTGSAVDYQPAITGGEAATFVQLDIAGLTGVSAIEFNFPAQQNGYVGYAELSALGSAVVSVPEPSSYALLLGGMGLLVFSVGYFPSRRRLS